MPYYRIFSTITLFLLLALLVNPVTAWGQADHSVKCGFGAGNLALRPALRMYDRPELDSSYISPSGNFKIHYDISGYHAVSATDTLPDGTPRFVYEAALAADSAYTLLIDHLGFNPPVSDPTHGPEYDIYMKNWGGQYYGMTYFSSTSSPAYLVIDNDYTETNYYTHGLDALRVTIAHEFFHMVQVHYSIPSPADYQYWYEMSSVWFEEYCYPEVNDYLAYIQGVFSRNPSPRLDDTYHQYGQGLFPWVLDKEYGFSQGKHIMTDLWEQLGTRDPIQNLKTVLASSRWNASSLQEALSLYGLYNSFTGSRAHIGQYYPDAALLPTVPFSGISIVPDVDRTDSYSIPPLSIYYNRYTINGFGNLLLSNTTPAQTPTVAQVARYGQNSSSENYGILQRNLVTSIDSVTSGDTLLIPTSNGSSESTNPMQIQIQNDTILLTPKFQRLFPNPVGIETNQLTLNLIVATAGKTSFTIFNLLGQEVDQQSFELYEGIRKIHLKLPDRLSSGLYIVAIDSPDDVYFCKFTYLK